MAFIVHLFGGAFFIFTKTSYFVPSHGYQIGGFYSLLSSEV